MKTPLLNRLLIAALVLAIGSYLVHELFSLDIWWHIVIGEGILRDLHVPTVNTFSAGGLDRPYHDSHWLFQAAVALSHRLAGLSGPILLMIAILGTAFAVLYREIRAHAGRLPAALLLLLAAGATVERFLPRPEIVTFLMVILFFTLLRRGRYRTFLQVLLLAVLQIVWVNCHGLFVIGPFMVGCCWLRELVLFLRKKENGLRPLSLLLGIVASALFVTPSGAGALRYSFLLLHEVGEGAPAVMNTVIELSPTLGSAAMSGCAFWFFAALVVLALLAIAVNVREVPVARLLIVAALGAAAFTGRRNMALFALPAAPFVAENLGARFAGFELPGRLRAALKGALVTALLLLAAYPLSGRYFVDEGIPARTGLGVTPDYFPHGLPDFIVEHGIEGQIYNSNCLGGFYLYHFHPERIPFVDGRWEVYDERFLDGMSRAAKSYDAWKEWVAPHDIRCALLHHAGSDASVLVPALYEDPEWSLVYYDFAAAFFVRSDAPGTARPIVFGPESRLPEGGVRPDGRFMLNSFFKSLGENRLLLENLSLLLPTGFHEDFVRLEMARANLALERFADAKTCYLEVLERLPGLHEALSDLSFACYRIGEYDEALAFADRALAVAPGSLLDRFKRAMALIALDRKAEAREELDAILEVQPGFAEARRLLDGIVE